MKDNWYNHVQSMKDNFDPIQRYLADTARDERLINSAFSRLNYNASKVVHTQHSAKQAQDASNRANNIKHKHMTTLNEAFLFQLQEALPEDVLNSIKDKHVNLKSPRSLGNNPVFNEILQNNPTILNQYDQIVSQISDSLDPWVQKFVRSTNALILENQFLLQFNLSALFNYPDGGNGTSPTDSIECKEHIQEIAREFTDIIALLYEEEIVLQAQRQEDEVKDYEVQREDDILQQPLGLPQNEEELLAMIEQLRADIEREKEENLRKDDIIDQQAEQIGGLSERLAQSQKLNQELRQDKSDLREHVSDLREVNLEKTSKLKQSEEIIAKQKSEYDLLKNQFDSIVGLGVQQEDEGSQLSGASDDLSIGSFELIGDQ
jgi:hypothetical protein